nr:T9SS type A sorting domain-containing protein [Flavobacterium agri]
MQSKETAKDALRLGDGSYIFAAITAVENTSRLFLAKYNSANRTDLAFGQNGTSILYDYASDVSATSKALLGLQSDGKIVVAIENNGALLVNRLTASGIPDPSFGNQGAMELALDGKTLKDMRVSSDDEVLVLLSSPATSTEPVSTLIRINTDASLDTTFGTNGQLAVGVGTTGTLGEGIFVTTDAIWVCGQSINGTTKDSFVLKYLSNGTPDITFQANGLKVFNIGGNDFASTIAVTSNSKVYVAGSYITNGKQRFYINEILSDGTLDPTHQNYITSWFSTYTDATLALWKKAIVDTSGRIAFYGNYKYTSTYPIEIFTWTIANSSVSVGEEIFTPLSETTFAFSNNGNLACFGSKNRRLYSADLINDFQNFYADLSTPVTLGIPLPSGSVEARDIDRLANGKYVVCAYGPDASRNGGDSVCLLGFLANGQPDSGFGQNGSAYMQGMSYTTEAFEVRQHLAPDGHIFLTEGRRRVCIYNENGTSNAVLALYDNYTFHESSEETNGKTMLFGHTQFTYEPLIVRMKTIEGNYYYDQTFSDDAYCTLPFSGQIDAYKVFPDGSCLVSGIKWSTSSELDIFVAKINQNGSLATSFGTNGIANFDFDPNENVHWMDVTASGKILLAVTSANGSYVMQLNSDGSIDTSFATNGKYITTGTYALALCLADNGDIIFGGNKLSRLNPDGALDTSFGVNGLLDLSFDGNYTIIETLKRQSDGKILAVGNGGNDSGQIRIFRLLQDGALGTIDFAKNESMIYPNPVENQTTFTYELTQDTKLTVSLYDLNGKLLKTYLPNETQATGKHDLIIDMPDGIQTGQYILRMSSVQGSNSVKLIKKLNVMY